MQDGTEQRAQEIGDQILRFIRSSNLSAGDQLPSEAEMAAHLGVSRATIREVYVRLLAKGAIVRRHGRGTFVGQMPIQDDQTVQNGFATSILAGGFTPTVDIISVERIAVEGELAEAFGVAQGTEVSRLLRLFRADGRPAVLIEDYLRPDIDAADIDLDRYGIDMIMGLASQVDMRGMRIDTWVTATALDEAQAGLFELPQHKTVLHIYSVIRPEIGGNAVCVAWAWLDPSLVELHSNRAVNLSAPSLIATSTEVTPVARRGLSATRSHKHKGN
jgi:GntR family transcriptional regulator